LPPDFAEIVEALLHRVRSDAPLTGMADWRTPKLFPCVSEEQIQVAEARVGFSLPPLLRDVYVRVGNGGFGPAYGLIGIEGGAPDDLGRTVEGIYEAFWRPRLSDCFWFWPEKLLPFCYYGCGIFFCVHGSSAGAPVYLFEPNIRGNGPWGKVLELESVSLAEWFESWSRADAQ
jgi:hypothetical protein